MSLLELARIVLRGHALGTSWLCRSPCLLGILPLIRQPLEASTTINEGLLDQQRSTGDLGTVGRLYDVPAWRSFVTVSDKGGSEDDQHHASLTHADPFSKGSVSHDTLATPNASRHEEQSWEAPDGMAPEASHHAVADGMVSRRALTERGLTEREELQEVGSVVRWSSEGHRGGPTVRLGNSAEVSASERVELQETGSVASDSDGVQEAGSVTGNVTSAEVLVSQLLRAKDLQQLQELWTLCAGKVTVAHASAVLVAGVQVARSDPQTIQDSEFRAVIAHACSSMLHSSHQIPTSDLINTLWVVSKLPPGCLPASLLPEVLHILSHKDFFHITGSGADTLPRLVQALNTLFEGHARIHSRPTSHASHAGQTAPAFQTMQADQTTHTGQTLLAVRTMQAGQIALSGHPDPLGQTTPACQGAYASQLNAAEQTQVASQSQVLSTSSISPAGQTSATSQTTSTTTTTVPTGQTSAARQTSATNSIPPAGQTKSTSQTTGTTSSTTPAGQPASTSQTFSAGQTASTRQTTPAGQTSITRQSTPAEQISITRQTTPAGHTASISQSAPATRHSPCGQSASTSRCQTRCTNNTTPARHTTCTSQTTHSGNTAPAGEATSISQTTTTTQSSPARQTISTSQTTSSSLIMSVGQTMSASQTTRSTQTTSNNQTTRSSQSASSTQTNPAASAHPSRTLSPGLSSTVWVQVAQHATTLSAQLSLADLAACAWGVAAFASPGPLHRRPPYDPAVQPAMSALADEIRAHHPRPTEVVPLAQFAWSMIRCSIDVPDAISLLSKQLALSPTSLAQLSMTQLVALLCAFGRARVEDDTIFAAASFLLQHNQQQLQVQHVTSTTWAFAVNRHRDERLLAVLCQHISSHLYNLSLDDLATLCWAFSRLRLDELSYADTVRKVEERALQMLPQFSPRQLATFVCACAHLFPHKIQPGQSTGNITWAQRREALFLRFRGHPSGPWSATALSAWISNNRMLESNAWKNRVLESEFWKNGLVESLRGSKAMEGALMQALLQRIRPFAAQVESEVAESKVVESKVGVSDVQVRVVHRVSEGRLGVLDVNCVTSDSACRLAQAAGQPDACSLTAIGDVAAPRCMVDTQLGGTGQKDVCQTWIAQSQTKVRVVLQQSSQMITGAGHESISTAGQNQTGQSHTGQSQTKNACGPQEVDPGAQVAGESAVIDPQHLAAGLQDPGACKGRTNGSAAQVTVPNSASQVRMTHDSGHQKQQANDVSMEGLRTNVHTSLADAADHAGLGSKTTKSGEPIAVGGTSLADAGDHAGRGDKSILRLNAGEPSAPWISAETAGGHICKVWAARARGAGAHAVGSIANVGTHLYGDPTANAGDPVAKVPDPAASAGDPTANAGETAAKVPAPAASAGDPTANAGETAAKAGDTSVHIVSHTGVTNGHRARVMMEAAELVQRGISHYSPTELIALAWAYAKVDLPCSKPVLDAVSKAVQPVIVTLDQPALHQLEQAFHRAGHADATLFQQQLHRLNADKVTIFTFYTVLFAYMLLYAYDFFMAAEPPTVDPYLLEEADEKMMDWALLGQVLDEIDVELAGSFDVYDLDLDPDLDLGDHGLHEGVDSLTDWNLRHGLGDVGLDALGGLDLDPDVGA